MSEMKRTSFPRLGETMHSTTLQNGLQICVFPHRDYTKAHAFFATRYGGIDRRFRIEGVDYDTPAGIAHFLEHKMFDMPDYNAMSRLAALGATDNAFTSATATAYHFECTENFKEAFEILIDYVSTPYFTAESVEKELGIIAQEIRMGEDSPGRALFQNLQAAMYPIHPIGGSIIGTVESISEITPETLYACHKRFYAPSNMVLCVAGNVDPTVVFELAEKMLPTERAPEIERFYGVESELPAKIRTECKMEVALPLFTLGLKLNLAENRLRSSLIAAIAGEIICGEQSPLFAELYSAGLTDRGFGYGDYYFPGGGMLIFSGSSREPDSVVEKLHSRASDLAKNGIPAAAFESAKRAEYGGNVRATGSPSAICRAQALGVLSGYSFTDFPEIMDGLMAEDVQSFIASEVLQTRAAVSIVLPK